METPVGMSSFVTALTGTDGITASNLWTNVVDAAPLITVAVLFAFGFAIIRRVVKGISKGKAKF